MFFLFHNYVVLYIPFFCSFFKMKLMPYVAHEACERLCCCKILQHVPRALPCPNDQSKYGVVTSQMFWFYLVPVIALCTDAVRWPWPSYESMCRFCDLTLTQWLVCVQVLWVIQVNWLQWLLVMLGAVLSGSVLLLTFWPAVQEESRRVSGVGLWIDWLTWVVYLQTWKTILGCVSAVFFLINEDEVIDKDHFPVVLGCPGIWLIGARLYLESL